jgi:hypothetical protein
MRPTHASCVAGHRRAVGGQATQDSLDRPNKEPTSPKDGQLTYERLRHVLNALTDGTYSGGSNSYHHIMQHTLRSGGGWHTLAAQAAQTNARGTRLGAGGAGANAPHGQPIDSQGGVARTAAGDAGSSGMHARDAAIHTWVCSIQHYSTLQNALMRKHPCVVTHLLLKM